MKQAELFNDCNNHLGEGPLWSKEQETLYWLDLPMPSKLFKLHLPTNLKSLGINVIGRENLDDICTFICHPNSDIHNLPFEVNKSILIESILKTDNRSINIIEKAQDHSPIEYK